MEPTQTPATAPANRGVLATLALSMLLASLGTSIANVALPELAQAFSAPFRAVQWVVIAYLATLTVSSVAVGWLGDKVGLRRTFLAGLLLFAVASLLCGVAPTLGLLVGARALQGVGAAILMALSMALVRDAAAEGQVGRAMGLLGTMSALGTALGPSLGGMLVAASGWHAVFLVQTPLALVASGLAFAFLPQGGAKRDLPQSMRATLNAELARSLAVNMLVASLMMATLVVGPFYLALGLGLRETLVGLVMSVGPAISIASGIPSGRAVDAWGAHKVLALGLVLLAVGAFLLALLPEAIGVGGYVLAIAVLTPGYQLFQAANNTSVLADIPKRRRGTVAGMLSLSRNIGLILGASAMGALFAYGVQSAEIAEASPQALAAGLRLTFLAAGGLMLAAIVLAFSGAIKRWAFKRWAVRPSV